MSDVPSLQVLADNHEALLLAEVAAWLHDMGKCADEHIINQASDKLADYSYSYKTAQSYRLPSDLPDISLLNEIISVKVLIEEGRPKVTRDASRPWLLRVLGCCHSVAHVEKELSGEKSTKQPKDDTRASTVFGFESIAIKGLTAKLDKLPFSSLQQRSKIVPMIQEAFEFALGDTRRPVNEVTLADWSSVVAALYKPALAGALLGVQPDLDKLRWRILRVNFDVLGLYAKAIKIADLMGSQKAVEDACTAVKKLVEEEYPLGNEIYRDTSGIYFTFPDLDLPADLEQEIRRRVEAVEPELAPHIAVEQPQGNTPPEQLKRMLAEGRQRALQDLAQPFDARNLSPRWQQEWETAGTGNRELCPVCRLRPMKEGQEACEICRKRRQSRIEWWQKNPQQTIWIDEVADTNGRLALIVGQFGLDDWLSGDLVQMMLVKAVENNPRACVPKNPSPARLRRIWETTRTFWQEVLPTDKDGDLAQSLVGQELRLAGPRLEIRGTLQPQRSGDTLVPYHTYELVVKGVRVSLAWDGERFITCDNLDYLAKPEQLGAPLEKLLTPEGTFTLEEPVGYGAKNKVWGNIAIEQVKPLDDNYTPAIPILAEPRTFMALVPANCALEVVKAIKKKYEREMGKVRNRLPLTLGVVYFGRRTPLAAALDAGRRMLKRERRQEDLWQVSNVTQGNGWPKEVKLTLSLGGQAVEIAVPTVMGDGATKDLWYPYWCVQGEPNDRKLRFDGPNGKQWVHVSELRKGDQVYFTPSTFDFESLDTAGRRFEVTYENGRRRAGEKAQRPYWLEQVDAIEHTWREMSTLSKSQIYQVRDLIENKRAQWGKPRGAQALPQEDVFRRFVGDVLREAGVYSEELERAALSGMLSDALELYLEIMKENPKSGGNHE